MSARFKARALAEARKAAQAETDRKVKAAVAAEAKETERLLDNLDKVKEQLADLRAARQELVRVQKAEIATIRREADVQKRRELREALRKQREEDREKISREERTKIERKLSQRQRALERSVKTLEEDKDRLERQVERLRASDQGEFNEEELFEVLRATIERVNRAGTRRAPRTGSRRWRLPERGSSGRRCGSTSCGPRALPCGSSPRSPSRDRGRRR